MKIIDQTPMYDENGDLSFLDRLKAFINYGRGWMAEMQAQRSVLPGLEKVLDKNYVLLRNVTPPGLDTPIPFILIGPTGVFVIYVTPVIGMFRAKGDQWGTISGNAFKPDRVNLLTRTERMARAVQVYLQRQGGTALLNVEAILLCADPGVHVDSLRPIVRVVMRDALERFAVSISQGNLVLRHEAVNEIVNLIINPPQTPEETPPAGIDQRPVPPGQEAAMSEKDPFNTPLPPLETGDETGTEIPAFLFEETQPPPADIPVQPSPKKSLGFSRKQWLFLAFLAILWVILIVVFIILVVKDLFM